MLLVEIVDTGVGLRGADPEALFQEWSQGASAALARMHGTGLGLPIVRRIVSAMGGAVGLREEARDVPRVFKLARAPLQHGACNGEAECICGQRLISRFRLRQHSTEFGTPLL